MYNHGEEGKYSDFNFLNNKNITKEEIISKLNIDTKIVLRFIFVAFMASYIALIITAVFMYILSKFIAITISMLMKVSIDIKNINKLVVYISTMPYLAITILFILRNNFNIFDDISLPLIFSLIHIIYIFAALWILKGSNNEYKLFKYKNIDGDEVYLNEEYSSKKVEDYEKEKEVIKKEKQKLEEERKNKKQGKEKNKSSESKESKEDKDNKIPEGV